MDPCHCGDVSSYYLVRMSQNRHVILCPVLPRDTDYVIISKHEVYHLDAGRGSSLGSVITLVTVRSFLSVNFPHMELRQSLTTPYFAALYLIDSFSGRIPSLV